MTSQALTLIEWAKFLKSHPVNFAIEAITGCPANTRLRLDPIFAEIGYDYVSTTASKMFTWASLVPVTALASY